MSSRPRLQKRNSLRPRKRKPPPKKRRRMRRQRAPSRPTDPGGREDKKARLSDQKQPRHLPSRALPVGRPRPRRPRPRRRLGRTPTRRSAGSSRRSCGDWPTRTTSTSKRSRAPAPADGSASRTSSASSKSASRGPAPAAASAEPGRVGRTRKAAAARNETPARREGGARSLDEHPAPHRRAHGRRAPRDRTRVERGRSRLDERRDPACQGEGQVQGDRGLQPHVHAVPVQGGVRHAPRDAGGQREFRRGQPGEPRQAVT